MASETMSSLMAIVELVDRSSLFETATLETMLRRHSKRTCRSFHHSRRSRRARMPPGLIRGSFHGCTPRPIKATSFSCAHSP